MRLQAARDLKAQLHHDVIGPLSRAADERVARMTPILSPSALRASTVSSARAAISVGVSAHAPAKVPALQRTLAIGIASASGKNNFRIAIRVQRRALMNSPLIDDLRKRSSGEIDVRYVSRIVKLATASAAAASTLPWYQRRHRPARIGSSVGHYSITAGTLGCFVTRKRDGGTYILSNNHVLANEDSAKAGDVILQAAHLDGGRKKTDAVAVLASGWVRFRERQANLLDCALARLGEGVEIEANSVRSSSGRVLGHLAGVNSDDDLTGLPVKKVGRTTGYTRGRVSAFELDGLVVNYDRGNLKFDNQIEIQNIGRGMFSDGGDSGSLIMDDDFRAVGVLFAGSETGGTNGLGITWANPIAPVLSALKAKLLY